MEKQFQRHGSDKGKENFKKLSLMSEREQDPSFYKRGERNAKNRKEILYVVCVCV